VREFSWAQIGAARTTIAPFVHRTPVFTCSTLDERCCGHVFLKCENLQRTGSFKFRGAVNAVASLTPDQRKRGVYAHSSGNHAQALALAARLHRIPAYVVMPEDSNKAKIDATRSYGAAVTFCRPTDDDRRATAARVGAETGAVFVHPHDDLRVIAGQGTAVCELIDEVADLDLILAPVGGGGLLAGTVVAAKHLVPAARVIGCEPSGADDAFRSIQRGERITDFTPNTIADGLRTSLGEKTFSIIRESVDEVVVVAEEEILPAMRFVWERTKLVIEPSSAVAVAPLLTRQIDVTDLRVGVILTGGNTDLSRLAPMQGPLP